MKRIYKKRKKKDEIVIENYSTRFDISTRKNKFRKAGGEEKSQVYVISFIEEKSYSDSEYLDPIFPAGETRFNFPRKAAEISNENSFRLLVCTNFLLSATLSRFLIASRMTNRASDARHHVL